ncbi:MAG TPA: histidine phosphatase family protein [Blastocatellia bacterium]|nr:histidine phosphatase family protein [Blastocatellia bacterium]
MSFIYLIRHGQAGTRDNYDTLSEVGQQQARLLGEHFAAQQIEFAAVVAGSLNRQRRTAEIACEAMASAGVRVPGVTTDVRWNEFSLLSVYKSIARRLMKEDEQFARDVVEMQEAIRRDPHTTAGATGRCDQAVIRAWMENRFPELEVEETWERFRSRVHSCAAAFNGHEQAVAVFTSATPIAIHAGAALALTNDKLISILGVIYNTSVTVLRVKNDDLRLFTFNSVAHLNATNRTLR